METEKHKEVTCARKGCGLPVAKFHLGRGMKFCSRQCAPLAGLAGAQDIKSDQMAASGSRAPGVDLPASRPFGRTDKKSTGLERYERVNKTVNLNESKKESTTMQTSKESAPAHEEGTALIPSIEPKLMPSVMSGQSAPTQEARSVEPSQILGRVESESMNSIDSCVKSLSELMTSAKETIDELENPSHMTPMLINSAAGCAAQIQKLLRLKLDIVRHKN